MTEVPNEQCHLSAFCRARGQALAHTNRFIKAWRILMFVDMHPSGHSLIFTWEKAIVHSRFSVTMSVIKI